jgi:hypothetical protein
MKALRAVVNCPIGALLLVLLTPAAANAGEPAASRSSPGFEPSEMSTDCIDREYRGKNAKLGLDYTDLINNCGQAVVITWQRFKNGAPQMERDGMGQSACLPPGGSVTTALRQSPDSTSETLPVSVVTCQ